MEKDEKDFKTKVIKDFSRIIQQKNKYQEGRRIIGGEDRNESDKKTAQKSY